MNRLTSLVYVVGLFVQPACSSSPAAVDGGAADGRWLEQGPRPADTGPVDSTGRVDSSALVKTWSIDLPAPTDGGRYRLIGLALADDALFVGLGAKGDDGFFNARVEKRDLETGALVSAFGGDGSLDAAETGGDEFKALAVDAAGLYLVWRDRVDKRDRSTGELRWTQEAQQGDFGRNSHERIALSGEALYLLGHTSRRVSGVYQVRLAVDKRARDDGSLDPSFGSGGRAEGPTWDGHLTGGLAVGQTTLVCGGGAERRPAGSPPEMRYALVAFDVTTGEQRWAAKGSSGRASALAGSMVIDGDGVIISGRDDGNRLERRDLETGTLAAGFGDEGSLTPDDLTGSLTIDRAKLLSAGTRRAQDGTTAWLIERRDPATGTLDPTFGDGGAVVDYPSTPDAKSANGAGLVAGGGAIYMMGLVGEPPVIRIEKRSAVTGEL